MGISLSFDTGVDLETQNGLFISGVGIMTEDSLDIIVGYYVSPYGKTTSEYIYKPITTTFTLLGKSETNEVQPTKSTKFSPGYFLANIKQEHTFDKETGIEQHHITFITKNYEKNVEEVTLKVQFMLEPGENYKSSNPDPTQCLDGQYIKKLDQTFLMGSDDPRVYSHVCQDGPVPTWKTKMNEYKTPLGGATLLLFVLILYMVFGGAVVAGSTTGNAMAMQQNRQMNARQNPRTGLTSDE
jgi:hypothetical protein